MNIKSNRKILGKWQVAPYKLLPSGLDRGGRFSTLVDMHKSIYSEQRFNAVSTIIVDYEMPGLNGLEFCKLINKPNITKILLTGYLCDKDAREAHNKGWIDMFLPKGEESEKKLSEMIADAEANFFKKSNGPISTALDSNNETSVPSLIKTKEFLNQAREKFKAVEYYLLAESGDYLLIDEIGRTCGLSVQTLEHQNDNIELATDIGVAPQLINQLRTRNFIFCHNGEQELPAANDWGSHIFPALKIDDATSMLGAFSVEIFKNKQNGIKAFKPVLERSFSEAISALGE